ncbi:MAG: low affinity iron permease family protein [Bdellovibrionota bacterium]
MKDTFRKIAHSISDGAGSPLAFTFAVILIVTWAIMGPVYGYSDTWQLVINTSTTIVTFLMVFLIQNTQNRDSKIIHLKLDELIRASGSARNKLIDLEDMSDEQLEKLHDEFCQLQAHTQDRIQQIRDKKLRNNHKLQKSDSKIAPTAGPNK